MVIKYKGYGVYRFLDSSKNTIYIGKSKNIYKRLFEQHFTKNGHLSLRGKDYNEVAKVEYIKLDDPADMAGLEIYLIDKYRPKWNKTDKRKDINNINYSQKHHYDNLEKWITARVFKPFDEEKIQINKRQSRLMLIFTYLMFILIMVYMIK